MEKSKTPGVENSGFLKDLQEAHHRIFGPGTSLNLIRDEALKGLAGFLNLGATNGGVPVDLYAWNRRVHTFATAGAIWGASNPFALDPELEEAFW